MKEKRMEELIRKRYSCRSYRDLILSEKDRSEMDEFISQKFTGPFGGSARFKLLAAESSDSDVLKGLGTYGFIRNPAAFIAGVIKQPEMNYEEFGYLMEKIILHATEIGLGTCWLGGSFKKSSFAIKAGIGEDEIIPAVASVGYCADKKTFTDRIVRISAGSDKRKDAGELFFGSSFNKLDINYTDGYGLALEMLRLAPSASNKQPWRVLKEDEKNVFHFFLERTAGYGKQIKLIGGADLQRVDMGIAMYHFESAAAENGLKGVWKCDKFSDLKIPSEWEYIVTWNGK